MSTRRLPIESACDLYIWRWGPDAFLWEAWTDIATGRKIADGRTATYQEAWAQACESVAPASDNVRLHIVATITKPAPSESSTPESPGVQP